ncbi:UNVERIFIED_CONTAM: hypothetical protein Slati_3516200 [Sesamum latifolium]|uniref:Uncharacterized protein n=1 Tax=Sesamum latifolium TaxID=2727402 RepID=A0AAW2UJ85_9LAMI
MAKDPAMLGGGDGQKTASPALEASDGTGETGGTRSRPRPRPRPHGRGCLPLDIIYTNYNPLCTYTNGSGITLNFFSIST